MPSAASEFDQLPPIQSELRGIQGSPEGVIKAPPGYEIVDTVTGNHYYKKSSADLNTGWKLVTVAA